jgi:AcrR family transcriptional regulator
MMPKKPDPRQRIIGAAFALSARQGWRATSLAGIATEAKLPIIEVYGHFRSKSAILEAFRRRIDAAVLSGAAEEEGERPRDRLFATLMRRFDALSSYKEGLRELYRESARDPLGAALHGPGLVRSMGWMLEAAGIGSAGSRGTLRASLLAGIYVSVFRVWLADDAPDMMKTMAVLDRRLRNVENWLGLAGSGETEKEEAASA